MKSCACVDENLLSVAYLGEHPLTQPSAMMVFPRSIWKFPHGPRKVHEAPGVFEKTSRSNGSEGWKKLPRL